MAIYRPGPAVATISGALGGAVYRAGRGSPTITTRSPRVRQDDPLHLSQRARWAKISHLWRSLTDDQRTQWRTMAANLPATNRLGVARTLSGWQIFHRYNSPLALASKPLVTTPPLPLAAALPLAATLTLNTSLATYALVWSNPPIAPAAYLLYGGLQWSTAKSPTWQRFRYLDFVAATASPALIISTWSAALPLVPQNATGYLRMVAFDFSRLPSAPLTLSTVAT